MADLLAVCRAMVRATGALLAVLTLLVAFAWLWRANSGDAVLWNVAIAWWLFAVVGLVGSFILHEWAHLVVLRRIPLVSDVAFQRGFMRHSVTAKGHISAGENALVAVAGPGLCAVLALFGWMIEVPGAFVAVYAGHVIFVLPPFGDGRSLLRSIAAWRNGSVRWRG